MADCLCCLLGGTELLWEPAGVTALSEGLTTHSLGKEGPEGCSMSLGQRRQPFPCPKPPAQKQRLTQRRDVGAYAASAPALVMLSARWVPVSLVQGDGVCWGAVIPSGVSLFGHRWRCLWSCLIFQALVPSMPPSPAYPEVS